MHASCSLFLMGERSTLLCPRIETVELRVVICGVEFAVLAGTAPFMRLNLSIMKMLFVR